MEQPLPPLDPHYQQLLQQMQQQIEQQAQQLAQQQQQLLAANAAAFHPTPVAAIKPLVKPKPPSTFNATDRAGELDQWEREMRYQFAAYGAALASDAARIAHAVSYLGPVPLQWWDANPDHTAVATWTDFVRRLRERFRPINAAKLARVEIFKLRQSPTQTAGAYAARFQEILVALPNMHEEDKIHLFVASLQPGLKRRIGDRDFPTLAAAINAAVQSEGLYGAHLATDTDTGAPLDSAMDVNAIRIGRQLASNAEEFDSEPLPAGPLSFKINVMEERLNAMRNFLAAKAAHRAAPGGPPSSSSSGPSLRRHPGDRIDIDPATAKQRLRDNACIRCGSRDHWKSECPQARQ